MELSRLVLGPAPWRKDQGKEKKKGGTGVGRWGGERATKLWHGMAWMDGWATVLGHCGRGESDPGTSMSAGYRLTGAGAP